MNLAEVKDLHALLIHEGTTTQLMHDALDKARELLSIKANIKWIAKENLVDESLKYMQQQGFDPNTTLILYVDPPDPNEVAKEESISEDTFSALSKLNKSQCVCWFMPNMTLEKFAKTINKLTQNKAFL